MHFAVRVLGVEVFAVTTDESPAYEVGDYTTYPVGFSPSHPIQTDIYLPDRS